LISYEIAERQLLNYTFKISEMQQRLVMRALCTFLSNMDRHSSDEVLGEATRDDWLALIRLFGALDPEWQPDY
jgi:hypothetical protein